MSNLSIVTYNCRGLNDQIKRHKLYSWFDSQKFDVVLLQETFCTKAFEPLFKVGWKGNSFIATSDSSHSRGVAILFRLGFEGDIMSTFASKDGRILIVNTEYKNNFLSFVSVYAPNSDSDRVVFFDKLHQLLCTHVINMENVVIAGDFNCCMNLSDRFSISIRADKSVQSLENLLKKCKLTDSWKSFNSGKQGYTYYDKKSNSHSRLDYIFFSSNFQFEIKNLAITQPVKNPGVVDHSALKLNFKTDCGEKGLAIGRLTILC